MPTVRFENGRAYSDEEITLDRICPYCKITGFPRDDRTGEVWMPDHLTMTSEGTTAHYRGCDYT